jgi:hypothetical protein
VRPELEITTAQPRLTRQLRERYRSYLDIVVPGEHDVVPSITFQRPV